MSQNIFRLSRVVIFGFGSIFLLMIAIGFLSKLSLDKLIEAVDWQTHTYLVKTNLQALEKDLVDAETGQRGFLFTNKQEYLEPYYSGRIAFLKSIIQLKKLIKDNPEQLKRLEKVEKIAQKKLDELAETISLKKAGKDQDVKNLVLSDRGKMFMDEIRNDLTEMLKIEDELLLKRSKSAKESAQLSMFISSGGIFFTLVFGVFIVLLIYRSIILPIKQITNTIASSFTEIATTVEQQERNAREQSSYVNQTKIAMDELGVSSQGSADQAQSATKSAQQALTSIEFGNIAVQQTLESMKILKQKVEEIALQIEQLNKKTNQISNISSSVTDLANQTNMLALNASIESVRVGENRKGFAIIATEIRKLADQSKKSVEEINYLVIDIKKAIDSTVTVTSEGTNTLQLGSEITKKTVNAFDGIANAVNNMLLNNQQISQTAQQQAIAIQQVVDAMNMINLSARETASGISQTKIGTQQLNQAAQKLNLII
ncbi:CHASE3 domain-containing protein [Kamptonema sp. UHCC 0994]|uniref:CHASE3 domain-containing protein n=1 Tax=Kamptonema sp. UHCC 0994 TaxID=3031329 RepID=UPI0023B9565F|nr:CHASE3 domain-containing protein [Kamptonema sp. UHCC 0994]MDF0553598.1 CHASE3 domain-containing protein [Kamptonema sp. UHCC 0994]